MASSGVMSQSTELIRLKFFLISLRLPITASINKINEILQIFHNEYSKNHTRIFKARGKPLKIRRYGLKRDAVREGRMTRQNMRHRDRNTNVSIPVSRIFTSFYTAVQNNQRVLHRPGILKGRLFPYAGSRNSGSARPFPRLFQTPCPLRYYRPAQGKVSRGGF